MPFDLTTGQMIVVLLRLGVPLLIPRYPFWGAVAAWSVDTFDVVIVEYLGPGGMGPNYHQRDKLLDLYYLAIEAGVAWTRWREWRPKRIAVGLFLYRLLGVILFEATGVRWLLFVFPNLFENWYLFVAGRDRFKPDFALDSWRRVLTWLFILYLPKIPQEYLLHISEAKPWYWFKTTILRKP